MSVGLREIYRQENKASVSIQTLEWRKEEGPPSLCLFLVLVPNYLVCSSQLFLVSSPHPQLTILGLVSMTVHFIISIFLSISSRNAQTSIGQTDRRSEI